MLINFKYPKRTMKKLDKMKEIAEALEEPKYFMDLVDKTKLAKSTLWLHLKEMEESSLVERKNGLYYRPYSMELFHLKIAWHMKIEYTKFEKGKRRSKVGSGKEQFDEVWKEYEIFLNSFFKLLSKRMKKNEKLRLLVMKLMEEGKLFDAESWNVDDPEIKEWKDYISSIDALFHF